MTVWAGALAASMAWLMGAQALGAHPTKISGRSRYKALCISAVLHHLGEPVGATLDLFGPLAGKHPLGGLGVVTLLDGREGVFEPQQPCDAEIEGHALQY